MARRSFFTAAALVAAFMFLAALPAQAGCASGAPPDDPGCRLAPHQSQQVNPAAVSGERATDEVSSSGSPSSAPVGDMPFVSASSLEQSGVSDQLSAGSLDLARADAQSTALGAQASTSTSSPGAAPSLDIRMRYQSADPRDVSCGVLALGMAMDGLDGNGPASSALIDFLEERGLLYEWGTGVEELAYAAAEFGYGGARPFHGATFEALRAELAAGRPVVVALGANPSTALRTGGEGVPGHFVTLTGISADGQVVSYNDPLLGKRVIGITEFQDLWELQGNSGVFISAPAAAGAPSGSLPLAAAAAAALAALGARPKPPDRKKRKRADPARTGVGGSLTPEATAPSPPEDTEPVSPTLEAPAMAPTNVPKVRPKVVGRQLVEKRRWVPAREIVLREGYYKTYSVREPYTAYRPRVRWVQKTVNVVKEVWEETTTWVSRKVVKPVTEWVRTTIRKPVTEWVRRTSSWFERTWLGRLVRRVKTWYEKATRWVTETVVKPVTRWVTQTVVEPVTKWVRRTIVEPVTKWVQETYYEPYTAYRTRTVTEWVEPVTKVVPGHWETYRVWEEVPAPVEDPAPATTPEDAQQPPQTVEDFEAMTAEERLAWAQALSERYDGWFNNIEGILRYFDASPTFDGLPQGSWMSWADAGTLATIQYGETLFETGSLPANSDPAIIAAAQGWARFFDQFHRDRRNIEDLQRLWGQAEQLGVNYGIALADSEVARPEGVEGELIERFTEVGNLYRGVNANSLGQEFGYIQPFFFPEFLETYYGFELTEAEAAALRSPMVLATMIGAPFNGEFGEWFYDPRSEIPLTDVNPAAMAAILLELKLLTEQE